MSGSLPVRERGSKPVHRCGFQPDSASLPVRERGSKRDNGCREIIKTGRSPCGSVDRNIRRHGPSGVQILSLPVRERGSKLRLIGLILDEDASLPVRERGSKQHNPFRLTINLGRSPCGSVDRNVLKSLCSDPDRVAPRAGAWIETTKRKAGARRCLVAPRAGAWIETSSSGSIPEPAPRRSPCGSVDRNFAHPGLPGDFTESLPVRERGSKRLLENVPLET